MNLVITMRAEIICLIILLFITLYSRFYSMGKDLGNFLRICIYAIGHVVFDLITVFTVNNMRIVPGPVNHLCHIIFYMFALLFSYEFFCYSVSICYSKKIVKRVRYIALIPLAVYLVAVPFLPMEYIAGNGTYYSFGTAAIVGYGVAMVLFLASVCVVVLNLDKMDKYMVGALLPMLGTAIVAEVIQILVPEMLFTGGTITIITVGFFFSLENPVVVLRQKVMTDAMTGVKSRHSYESDIVNMEQDFKKGTQFGMVFCDINDLKIVNDTKGHLEGDTYIACIAQVLMKCLKNSETIYRMGGDEFLAIYRGKNVGYISKETADIQKACEEESKNKAYPVSAAIGYAISDSNIKSLRDVLNMADFQMYMYKSKIKQRRDCRINDSNELDVTGLTDRVFDALAITDPNRFLFVSNMSTNVTRWSVSAAEYFGMNGEFIYDVQSFLYNRVHPDDADTFFSEISAVFSGKQIDFQQEFRILNGIGDYITCSCSGTVLRGKNDNPDLFAGTMFVRNAAESIDRLTELRNSYEMMNYFNHLIHDRISAALIEVSIVNLNRINMLYGYVSGNEIVKQFSAVVREITGASGSVFRSEGTKFVICLPNSSSEDIKELYRKIRFAAEQKIHLDALTPPLQIAAGAYVLPKDFNGTSSFLRSNLIYAFDRSKYEEHGKLVFYDALSETVLDSEYKNRMLSIHQDAIATREGFFLVYQSIISAKTGKIIGSEALLRWSNETFGIVNPDNFIPWLEGDPCFFGLGNWILRRALTETKSVLEYLPDFIVNINISMSQLEHEGFRDAVLNILDETKFPPSQLCLELTERCRELNSEYLKEEIDFFRSHGIRVALDDLGTGFSSFGLLLSLNVDEIKLDRAFVKEIRTQRVNQILTQMLIDASNSMGYDTCLEGVEDKELCRYLQSYGATYYQGYYCDRPAEINDFIEHIKNWNDISDN